MAISNPSEQFAADLRACLDAADSDAALVAFSAELPRSADLPAGRAIHGGQTLPQLVGLAPALIAEVLVRQGHGEAVITGLTRFADLFTPAHSQGQGLHSYFLPNFPYLYKPLIDLALTARDQDLVVDLIDKCRGVRRTMSPATHLADPLVAALLAHPKAAHLGALDVSPAWMMERQEQAMALGPMDQRLARIQDFQALLLESALLAERPERVEAFVDATLPLYMRAKSIDTSHFEFNAICVLAALGRLDEALANARELVRRGYALPWRFDLERAKEMGWTQDMRQNEWLGPLAATAAYQDFVRIDIIRRPARDENDPADNPLSFAREDTLGGKTRKRCFVSRKFIEPGAEVVRIRRLFERASDGDFEIAAKGAFEASPWQTVREQFERNAVPLRALFPHAYTRDADWHDPEIATFHYDIGRDEAAFDMARAIALIAEAEPPPIEFTWSKGADQSNRWAAFDPLAGANGHGDAVNLTWRLIRAGHRDDILRRATSLAPDKADKVFAMLATFADDALRRGAGEHFAAPALPELMARTFASRPSLDDHLALADFASRQPRFRAGLVAAMRGYGLHLYSNYRPTVDWFLQGLEHYALAGGSRLLSALIHHPQDDPILATALEKMWLPDRAGGSIDAYGNTRRFYLRVALFHLALHAPDRLDAWLDLPWLSAPDGASTRETLRLVKQLRVKAAKRRS